MAMEDCSDHGWRIESICDALFVPAPCCDKSVSRASLYGIAGLLTDPFGQAVKMYLFCIPFKSCRATLRLRLDVQADAVAFEPSMTVGLHG
jgi:hypothetical protein